MKLASTTPAPDFTALRELTGVHDADFEAQKLVRARAIYAARYARLQELLLLDDEGYEVTITVRSHSKTLTLTQYEGEACFDLNAVYGVLGRGLDALKDQILDCLAGTAPTIGLNEAENQQLRQAHMLCLPANPTLALATFSRSSAAQAA